MADYKSTINLPNTGFPMKADLANREPRMLAAWERDGLYEKIRLAAKGPAVIHSHRWPAVREWHHPPGSCGQQDSQGHHRQVAHLGWLRCPLCAGLGLSWAADRDAGRENAWPRRTEDRCQNVSRRLPGIRAQTGRCAAQRFQALRGSRRLGSALLDHDAALSRPNSCAPFL